MNQCCFRRIHRWISVALDGFTDESVNLWSNGMQQSHPPACIRRSNKKMGRQTCRLLGFTTDPFESTSYVTSIGLNSIGLNNSVEALRWSFSTDNRNCRMQLHPFFFRLIDHFRKEQDHVETMSECYQAGFRQLEEEEGAVYFPGCRKTYSSIRFSIISNSTSLRIVE